MPAKRHVTRCTAFVKRQLQPRVLHAQDITAVNSLVDTSLHRTSAALPHVLLMPHSRLAAPLRSLLLGFSRERRDTDPTAGVHCLTRSVPPPPLSLFSSSHASGLLHATRLCRERNVVRNTLADTPSGYIQDPRAQPRTMTRYDGVSRVGAAVLEAMEREKELLGREELAYRGYTTLRIQELKQVVLQEQSTEEELRSAAEELEAELRTVLALVGQEVDKPISTEHVLLLKWQQRQQRLHDRDLPFQVAQGPTQGYRLVLQPDGTEVLERLGRDAGESGELLAATDDRYLSQPVEMETLPPSALVPDKTVVTIADVNHVRYLIGLALRRLSHFEGAEKLFYAILADDVTNVDAVESLLEMDLGVEGWEPRIRVLLDYLVTEYTRAVEEGRLPSPQATQEEAEAAAAAEPSTDAAAGVTASSSSPPPSSSSASAVSAVVGSPPTESSPASVESAATTAVSEGTGDSLAPSSALTKADQRDRPSPYKTLPQMAPVDVALSLLSDLIVEAAAQKCSADGEGAASRFFIEALGPIVRVLGRDYAPLLLEALFQAVDEQHFMARFDADDVTPAARAFSLSLVIAFLKALTARRIHELLPEPVRFEFFTLTKLHAALRKAGRVHESYNICEQLMRLYRAHSAVYRTRARATEEDTLASPSLPSTQALRKASGQLEDMPLPRTADVSGEASGELQAATTAPSPRASPDAPSAALPAMHTEEEALAAALASEPPDILDDQDAEYREAFFQYVNDRARDSPALGRRLCLEAMHEFPRSAAPWETLALLLHKEDPEKKLADAIIAARHAMVLEPLNIGVIVTLANFYKAAKRYELHDRMLDRYRLLTYMAEEGASEEDMLATAAEVEGLDKVTPEAQDLVEETGREMSEYLFRLEQATTYSMPIDKEPRAFGDGPIKFAPQQLESRPREVGDVGGDPERPVNTPFLTRRLM